LKGKHVVVHCDSGKGRSVFFVAAVLIQLGASLEKAKQILRTINEEVSNPAHILYLSKLKYKVLAEYEKEIIVRVPGSREIAESDPGSVSSETEPNELQQPKHLNDTTFSV